MLGVFVLRTGEGFVKIPVRAFTKHNGPNAVRSIEGESIMAVPKRKMGRARTHARRSSNDVIKAPSRSVCPQCGEVKLPHRVCPNCGFYKNREVIETE